MVRQRKTSSLLTEGCPHLKNFRTFSELQESLFGVVLPVPTFEGDCSEARLRSLKRFCGGLLEGDGSHLWYGPTRKLSADARWSIAMSLFLFRKVLPSERPSLLSYCRKMAEESESPDEGFLQYCRDTVPKIFRKGWDATLYPDACLSSTIPVKSCVQLGLGDGGARHYAVTSRWDGHQDYVLEVLTAESFPEVRPSKVRCVETAGKHRIVSVSDVNANLFRPLHNAMYRHMSRFPWLLRGDAKPSRFKEFVRRDGEVFVSGDYESATDNLNHHVQQLLLDLVLDSTVAVPAGIRDAAHIQLSTGLELERGWRVERFQQRRGQLMGNLLSFPLLCLVNYLAFRYFSGSKGPVRINGDDIVFRATVSEYESWRKGVVKSGLVLSKGKTLVHPRYFTLNSALFKAAVSGVSAVPYVRSTALGFKAEKGGVGSLAGRFYACSPGFWGKKRSLIRSTFLKINRSLIFASRRSLTRGLGMKVRLTELVASGLVDREEFYLSLPREQPLPPSPAVLEQQRVPPGWSLREVDVITKEIREASRAAGPEFVACAWSPTECVDSNHWSSWEEQVKLSGFSYDEQRTRLKKRARLLGLSARNARRFLSRCLLDGRVVSKFDFLLEKTRRMERRKRVWLPDDYLTSSQMAAQPSVSAVTRAPVFISGGIC